MSKLVQISQIGFMVTNRCVGRYTGMAWHTHERESKRQPWIDNPETQAITKNRIPKKDEQHGMYKRKPRDTIIQWITISYMGWRILKMLF